MRVPLCEFCGEQHFNFRVCDEKADATRKPLNPPRFNAPGREFGNRTDKLQILGGSTIVVKKTVARTLGRIIRNPAWGPR